MRIAFIGAGLMGYGIALNLIKSGHQVKVIAHKNRKRIEKLVKSGAVEADNYETLLNAADAIVTCVGTADQLESIVSQAQPYLESTNLWIDCTTSKPQVAESIAFVLKKAGVDFVDAPVTRSPSDAEAGRLVSLVGASAEVFYRARPLIECYSESITHLGGLGAGLRAKLINNFITMGQVALVVEGMRAAEEAGIDQEELYNILIQGAANSGTLKKMVGPALKGDFSGHSFSLGNGTKDVHYASEMHEKSDTGHILAQALAEYFDQQCKNNPNTILLSELLKHKPD